MVSDSLCRFRGGENTGGGIGIADLGGGRNGVGGHLGRVRIGEVAGCSRLKADDGNGIAEIWAEAGVVIDEVCVTEDTCEETVIGINVNVGGWADVDETVVGAEEVVFSGVDW